jgi:hypothetical protein
MPNAVAASATRSSTTAVVTDDHDTHPAQVAGFRRGSWFGARLDDVVDALGQLRQSERVGQQIHFATLDRRQRVPVCILGVGIGCFPSLQVKIS